MRHEIAALSALTVFLSVSTVVGLAEEPKASRQDFQQFGELLVGRWVGDIKQVYEWPGEDVDKGDTITSYAIFKWVADTNGVEWEHFGGNTTGKTLIAFDAPSGQIKAFNIGSAGTTWQTVIWKKTPERWGWRFTGGGLLDGKGFRGEGDWIFASEGDKLTITGDMTVGNEKVDRFDDVYHRVSK